MNFSPADFVTPENIISDVVRILDDEDFRYNTEGYYKNQMQYSLQELAFDTFFDIQIKDFGIPENLRLPLPPGSFNVREIYAFNGDLCNISSGKKIWWKRNYITGGNGFLARDRGSVNDDPFYQNRSSNTDAFDNGPNSNILSNFRSFGSGADSLLFYNIQGGIIMLSPGCRAYQKIAIVFNGTGCDNDDVPCIPNYLREPVKLWVADVGVMTRISKSMTPFDLNKWRGVQNDVQLKLNGRSNRAYDGAWYNAEYRVKKMDKNARQDLKEYFSRLVK